MKAARCYIDYIVAESLFVELAFLEGVNNGFGAFNGGHDGNNFLFEELTIFTGFDILSCLQL